MDNEPYYDLTHDEACEIVAQRYRWNDCEVKREFVLPNGKIADVFVRLPDWHFVIIEVKTELKSSLLDAAVGKYYNYCNGLWMAVPHMTKRMSDAIPWQTQWRQKRDVVGVMGVERDGMNMLRVPHGRELPAQTILELRKLLCQS